MDLFTIELIFAGLVIFWFVGYFIYYLVSKYNSKCIGNGTAGTSCGQNCECASGACGKLNANGDPVCCPNGETTTVNGLVFCAGYPNGSSCGSNGMCKSGSCVNGKCAPAGNTCDASCKNGCGKTSAAPGAPTVCCDPNGTVNVNGQAYCNNSAYGTPCNNNSMCASGYCSGTNSSGAIGTCGVNIYPYPNKPCSSNGDCSNNACGRWGPGGPLVCCPSGETSMHAFYDYCTQMPNGGGCWNGSYCKSGNCVNNVCQP